MINDAIPTVAEAGQLMNDVIPPVAGATLSDTAPLPIKIGVRHLDFSYKSFHALKDINLEVPEKRVTAFIGPSGCGKSTLLRTFNRMYDLYPGQRATGEILLDGENILDRR